MKHNVVIIGAGPAGLSCALWLSNQGIDATVLEAASEPCGMLRCNHHANDWLLGFPDATGLGIAEKFLQHLQNKKIQLITSVELSSIEVTAQGFSVGFSSPTVTAEIACASLVLATGMRPRCNDELRNLAYAYPEKFIIGAGALHLEDFAANQRVAILGGGDNAFENAYLIAKRGGRVDVYCRAEVRARDEWQSRCRTMNNISIHPHTHTTHFSVVAGQVQFFTQQQLQQVAKVIVMFGYEPNTAQLKIIAPWLDVICNGQGFIRVNDAQQTDIPQLYAAGDVTNRPHPNLPSSIGQGSVAGKAIGLSK